MNSNDELEYNDRRKLVGRCAHNFVSLVLHRPPNGGSLVRMRMRPLRNVSEALAAPQGAAGLAYSSLVSPRAYPLRTDG